MARVLIISFLLYVAGHIPILTCGVYVTIQGLQDIWWIWTVIGSTACISMIILVVGMKAPPSSLLYPWSKITFDLLYLWEALFLAYLFCEYIPAIQFTLCTLPCVLFLDLTYCYARDSAFLKNPSTSGAPTMPEISLASVIFNLNGSKLKSSSQSPSEGNPPGGYPLHDLQSPGKVGWISRLTRTEDERDYHLLPSDETLV